MMHNKHSLSASSSNQPSSIIARKQQQQTLTTQWLDDLSVLDVQDTNTVSGGTSHCREGHNMQQNEERNHNNNSNQSKQQIIESILLDFFRDFESVATPSSVVRHTHPETLWIEIQNGQIVHHAYLNKNMDEHAKARLFSYEAIRIESIFVDRTQAVAAVTFQDSESSSSNVGETTTKIAIVSLLKTPQTNNSWIIFTMIVSTFQNHNNKSNSPNNNVDRLTIREACMDRYLKSNRACDGKRMAQVFHPLARLIQIPSPSNHGKEKMDSIPVTVISQPQFCQLVQSRYESSQSPHAPYANLADKDRHDLWLGGALLGETLAVGHLRMGHPPFVWTDLLVLAKLENNGNDKTSPPKSDETDKNHDINDEDGTTWWILAKTSHAEPFFPDNDSSMLNSS